MKNTIQILIILTICFVSCKRPEIYEIKDPTNLRAKALKCSLRNELFIDAPVPLYLYALSGYAYSYQIRITSNTYKDINLNFYTFGSDIKSGEYIVEDKKRYPKAANGVVILIGEGDQDGNSYSGVSGIVRVNASNGQYIITFCDVNFRNTAGARHTLFKGYGESQF